MALDQHIRIFSRIPVAPSDKTVNIDFCEDLVFC